jgi:branched-chain amino acid transport system ATP-binding protein
MKTALQISGLNKSFGGLHVTRDVTLSIDKGERRLLIGPNGAGKTTLFNLIAGDILPDTGTIKAFGENISTLPAFERVHKGLARTYQILTLFGRNTLIHNVMLALLGRTRKRWRFWGDFTRDDALRAQARSVLASVGLGDHADRPLAQTSYGEKRRLEIAMALAQQPAILLLDEPLAGLSAEERGVVLELLESISRDITIVMIEHDMEVALQFADTVTLLHYGQVIVSGTRQQVVEDPRTREIYLGH